MAIVVIIIIIAKTVSFCRTQFEWLGQNCCMTVLYTEKGCVVVVVGGWGGVGGGERVYRKPVCVREKGEGRHLGRPQQCQLPRQVKPGESNDVTLADDTARANRPSN